MTTPTLRLDTSSPSLTTQGARLRWRGLRDLLSGALILAIWLSLWSWVTFGVAAPLGRIDSGLARDRVVDLRA